MMGPENETRKSLKPCKSTAAMCSLIPVWTPNVALSLLAIKVKEKPGQVLYRRSKIKTNEFHKRRTTLPGIKTRKRNCGK